MFLLILRSKKEKIKVMKSILRTILLCAAVAVALSACEGDHEVIETDWTTLETVELQKHYNKYMDGDWVYQYDDTVHYIEMSYSFSTKDSTFSGYYNELINIAPSNADSPDWQLLWQGSFSGKWVLLHSVDLDQDYIYMGDMVFNNVHGVLAKYDVLGGRVLFYGASKNFLRVTTPLTFKRIDMRHPENPAE
jgi:hypothetical protein